MKFTKPILTVVILITVSLVVFSLAGCGSDDGGNREEDLCECGDQSGGNGDEYDFSGDPDLDVSDREEDSPGDVEEEDSDPDSDPDQEPDSDPDNDQNPENDPDPDFDQELCECENEEDSAEAQATPLSPETLTLWLENKDFVLINVHVPYDGQIAGTDVHISYLEPEAIFAYLGNDLEVKVVVYCKSNYMALISADDLLEAGYVRVYYLDGGMRAWTTAGYELEER